MVFNVLTLYILIRFLIKTYTFFVLLTEVNSSFQRSTRLIVQSKDYETEYEVKDEDAALEQEQHQPAPDAPLLEIRISMFLGLQDPDPDPLVRGTDPDPSLFWKNICKTRF